MKLVASLKRKCDLGNQTDTKRCALFKNAASEFHEADLQNDRVIFEQVDIIISKNQALQI